MGISALKLGTYAQGSQITTTLVGLADLGAARGVQRGASADTQRARIEPHVRVWAFVFIIIIAKLELLLGVIKALPQAL